MAVIRQAPAFLVALTDGGRRCGETHAKARISDAQVDEIRELHEQQGLGYKRIAQLLGLTRDTVRAICTYRSRACTVVATKRINLIG